MADYGKYNRDQRKICNKIKDCQTKRWYYLNQALQMEKKIMELKEKLKEDPIYSLKLS